MDPSDSFYEYDIGFDSTFSNPKPVSVSLYQTNEDSLGFSDIAPYNEESIDIQQYLHLGNTPPNGDELLKQFGAYSNSPPITVNVIRPNAGISSNSNSNTLSQGFARVSLSNTSSTSLNSNTSSVVQQISPSIVQANVHTLTAPAPEPGFKIKQEFVEQSVPDFEETSMPPGEEQNNMIAKGDQGNHIGGQQTYILSQTQFPQGEDVVTTSSPADTYGVQAFEQLQGQEVDIASGESVNKSAKKRQRSNQDKESVEYKSKRQRNNMAVRKSREKSKVRNNDLQSKVQTLQSENDRLNKKVELLSKELTVLRSLFTTVKPSSGQ